MVKVSYIEQKFEICSRLKSRETNVMLGRWKSNYLWHKILIEKQLLVSFVTTRWITIFFKQKTLKTVNDTSLNAWYTMYYTTTKANHKKGFIQKHVRETCCKEDLLSNITSFHLIIIMWMHTFTCMVECIYMHTNWFWIIDKINITCMYQILSHIN